MTSEQRHALRDAADACGSELRRALDDCPMNWELIETWGRTLVCLAELYMASEEPVCTCGSHAACRRHPNARHVWGRTTEAAVVGDRLLYVDDPRKFQPGSMVRVPRTGERFHVESVNDEKARIQIAPALRCALVDTDPLMVEPVPA